MIFRTRGFYQTNKKRYCSDVIAYIHCWLVGFILVFSIATQADSFVTFESGQVRPTVLSSDGKYLFVTNTPDNRLEVFATNDMGLEHAYSIPVGLEPVAVAEAPNGEVWVVNHLSDSVSIVKLFTTVPSIAPRVIRTVQVGDEPRDIVFAGGGNKRAFITTAHRGQNSPVDFQPFKTRGRADVWVLDAVNPLVKPQIITLFGDTPRALATNADGTRIYVGIFNSGNQTTVLSASTVAGNMPPPLENVEGIPGPRTGLIVQFDGNDWKDSSGQVWSGNVGLDLPDWDVFTIDAMAYPAIELARTGQVGTTLFNMITNPITNKLYVSNLEAMNQVRFEGPGTNSSTVRGHFIENRISVISDPLTLNTVDVRHLNKHINYETFPGTSYENTNSLATPTGATRPPRLLR